MAASLLLALAGLALSLISHAIAPLMPRGPESPYEALRLGTTCLPALLAPGLVGFVLLGRAPSRWIRTGGRLILGLALIAILLLNALPAHWSGVPRPALLAGAFVGAWLSFALIARHVLAKGCLVK